MISGGKRIVIGIPSFNEEDSIGYVVKQVDLGVKKYYPEARCLIVNVDSNSEDQTKKAFLNTTTFFPKKYLNAGKKLRGKGKNLIELFKYCNRLNADFVILLDGDIKSIKPSWVFSLLKPLVKGGYDYVTPVYSRGCYDGNVTNNFAYPLTYALFGVKLQQPIGGEFGLNKRLYKYLLKQKASNATLGFGIDIFMTYHAIGGGFKICERYLGQKKHKPGFSSLMDKFLQFSQSAIEVSKIYRDGSRKIKSVKAFKDIHVFKTRKRPDQKLVSVQLKQFAKFYELNFTRYRNCLGSKLANEIAQTMLLKRKPLLSLNSWVNALAILLSECYKKEFNNRLISKMCNLIAPIFYWRAISFWHEIEGMSPLEIDRKIWEQSKLLRSKLAFN